MRRLLLSRRRFLAGLPAMAALCGPRAEAQEADRGLGGTGAVPEVHLGEDRGIGGTGVIGTIRRFGSIVVNDLRITFPRTVPVTIDGRRAALSDLKLGHVVQVLARAQDGQFSTQTIATISEVAGPIEAVGPGAMVVLGQRVELPASTDAMALNRGDVVAVSGLRRLDGVIVASLVERRGRGPFHVAGPAFRDANGGLKIGDLPISGLSGNHVGNRIAVMGTLDRGVLRVSRMMADPFAQIGARPSRLSIEAYVTQRPDDDLQLGSGQTVQASNAIASVSDTDGPVRAIVSADVGPRGALRLEGLKVKAEGHGRRSGVNHGAATTNASNTAKGSDNSALQRSGDTNSAGAASTSVTNRDGTYGVKGSPGFGGGNNR